MDYMLFASAIQHTEICILIRHKICESLMKIQHLIMFENSQNKSNNKGRFIAFRHTWYVKKEFQNNRKKILVWL